MRRGGKHLPVNYEAPHLGREQFAELAGRGNGGQMSGPQLGLHSGAFKNYCKIFNTETNQILTKTLD